MLARSSLILLVFSATFFPSPRLGAGEFPPTDKQPAEDEYHGVKVTEDYRWLEAAGAPAVKAWADAQNRHTRAYLDALPDRPEIAATLKRWYDVITPSYGYVLIRPGRLFAFKFQPPKQQELLVTLVTPGAKDSERLVLDPNELEPRGQVAMDWYVPSRDGEIVAVCLSENGSEDGSLNFYRTATGERLPDRLPRVQYPTGGGSAAWTADGRTIFYTRYPHAGERPEEDLNFYQQVYVHRIGTPASADVYAVGKDFPRIAEIELDTSHDGRWLLATVANGDGGEHDHHLLDLRQPDVTAWRQITRFADGVKDAVFARDGTALYLRSVQGAPRGQVLRLALDSADAALKDAVLTVPESAVVIESLSVTDDHLYVTDLAGGPSQVRQFGLTGGAEVRLPLPENVDVAHLAAMEDGSVLFRQRSFTEPNAYYRLEPKTRTITKTALASGSPVDFEDIEVVREFAISKDGTKVPLSILRRKGTMLGGNNPMLLTGYGGYGISLGPYFDFTKRLWFDRGGVYAVANIRGGGEYGEAWHLAGNLTHKQNVFDDFAACARHLIARGYTHTGKLAIEGGSNGGLLMGAMITQHPDLFRAVVAHVGIYDMLRVELDPNGAFNVTEFGTVKDPQQFAAIHAYSPYHRVVDGTRYPAVFFLSGETDGRVNPGNSRKMTARLQAATASGHPILLRQTADAGHGMGTALSEEIAQTADVFAFLFSQLDMAKPE